MSKITYIKKCLKNKNVQNGCKWSIQTGYTSLFYTFTTILIILKRIFKMVRFEICVWMGAFEIIKFEIKIIFFEIKEI